MIPKFTEECPPGVGQIEFEVTEDMARPDRHIHIGVISRQVQVAVEKFFCMNFGVELPFLISQGIGWAVVWSDTQIRRMPELGEKLILRIWPSKRMSVMFSFKYAFYTTEGEPMISYAGLYVFMDHRTRTMCPAPDFVTLPAPVLLQGEPDLPALRVSFPEIMTFRREKIVTKEELDYNGHLNNSNYVDWMESVLSQPFCQCHRPIRIWITFQKELREGDEAEMSFDVRGDSFYARGFCHDTESFALRMDFAPQEKR